MDNRPGNNPEISRPVKAVRSEREERLRIGITPGDGTSLCYEAVARLFGDSGIFDGALPFLYGSAPLLAAAGEKIGLNEKSFLVQKQIQDIKGRRIQVFSAENASQEEENDTFLALQQAVSHMAEGHVRALVSLPVSEDKLRERHPEFKNQAMTVASAFVGNPFRMLLTRAMRLSFLTTVKREDAETYLSAQRVEQRILDLYAAIKSDFSITTPRIAVLGMEKDLRSGTNAEADVRILKPLVNRLFEKGIPVFGPYPAHAFFHAQERFSFDAVLCMYREQAECVFDTCPKEECCYYTASSPVLHLEPIWENFDAEKAFRSLFRAVCRAIDIDAARQQYRKLTENPLGYHIASSRREMREN